MEKEVDKENKVESALDLIKKAVDSLGYKELTPIQRVAIPKILAGKNTLIIAPTGYGKTEASVLPVFSMMSVHRSLPISSIYVTPLRSLNRDIHERLYKISSLFNITVSVRHGDSSTRERRKVVDLPPDMIITTPESLGFLLLNTRMRERLANVRWIIIDELQEMLDDKRGYEFSIIIERLKKISHFSIQLIGLSATIGDISIARAFIGAREDDGVARVDEVKEIEIDVISDNNKNNEINKSIHDERYRRISTIAKLIVENRPVILFTNTRETAEFLTTFLKNEFNIKVEAHHGSLSRESRMTTERKFKDGELDAIVATSSLELGIDVGKVNTIIQYGSPRQAVRLLQRIGRSGHSYRRKSKGILIPVNDFEDELECYSIAHFSKLGVLETPLIEKMPLDVVAHQVTSLILEGYEKPEEIYDIIRESPYYRDLSFEDFQRVLEFLSSVRVIKWINNKLSKGFRIWKYTYGINMIPDSTKSFVAVDIQSGDKIGNLDRDFVVTLSDGDVLVLGGKLWKVIEINSDKVILERSKLPLGVLPHWIGETIPVEPHVGALMYKMLVTGECYDVGEYNFCERLRSNYEKYLGLGHPPLNHDEILVEVLGRDLVVITSPFGSRGNNTLGAMLADLLFHRTGWKVSYKSEQLHIALSSSLPLRVEDIQSSLEYLKHISREEFLVHLEEAVRNSPQYVWKLLVEAKRIGAVDPDIEEVPSNLVLRQFGDTLVGEEAVKELITKSYYVELYDLLNKYKFKVIQSKFPSPLSQEFVARITNFEETTSPVLVEVVKRRLLDKSVKFICLSCGWSTTRKVKESPKSCERCSSIFLALTYPDDDEAEKIIKRAISDVKLKRDERKKIQELRQTASLYSEYKQFAAMAIAAPGVGPSNLGRVLSNLSMGEDKLISKIVEEERRFYMTRKYWQDR